MSSEKGQGCSKTQGKDGDTVYKQGWKLLWKGDEWVRLLSDLCLADELSQEKVLLAETSSRCTSIEQYVHERFIASSATFWLGWSRNARHHHLDAKKSWNKPAATMTKPQILSGSIIGLWKVMKKKHLGGSTAEMLLASLATFWRCHCWQHRQGAHLPF